MKEEEIKTKDDVHWAITLIRDMDDCPEEIVELIDNVRYSKFYEYRYRNEED